jgi:hypothetical protein
MLEERLHPARNGFPERPETFELRGRPQPIECCEPLERAGWFSRFQENGRGFYVYVYLGRHGTRTAALAILDSLRVEAPSVTASA